MVRIAAVSASDPAVRTSASAGAASLIAVCPVVAAPLPQGAGVGLKPVEAGHMRTPADAVAPGLMSAGAAGRVDAARTCEEQPADAVAAAVSGMSAGAAGEWMRPGHARSSRRMRWRRRCLGCRRARRGEWMRPGHASRSFRSPRGR
ncbi:hypothetical protein I546_4852 [Mycobacterium kansasii 732]|nr:hypothetical protein I546_4852 [Mycobacterium kansasii 732]